MAVTPEWTRSHELIGKDIAKAAKKDGLQFSSITDLVNTTQRYPSVVPVLIDWLQHLDERVPLTDPKDLGRFRSGIIRALTTIDAMGTEAVPLLMDEYYRQPQMSPGTLFAIGNALRYLAVPTDHDRIATLAADRTLGSGRAALLEWLIEQGTDDGLRIVLDQIDDPSVRALGIKYIRQFTPLPTGLRPAIERYVGDSDREVRKQAKATLKKLPQ
ncbi:hypothetical protein QSJ19_24230 [Gordonia sp. ABSL11-1]|uniref:hypothetical protein n=1 Tax=Gordonia sp. ABSL11-1 TaxID=3053924 RepID=UPI0025728D7E|nr:hypothetical protein [Gordonia sp. ABSL11-1]MDL9948636.1 hypothetical protein [Gordonia sp. ABSL11-1]